MTLRTSRGLVAYVGWLAALTLGCLFAIQCSAQTTASAPAFEVVSIKHLPNRVRSTGLANNSGRMRGTATLTYLLTNAYGVHYKRLIAPEWVSGESYEVAAIAPPEASKETRMQMLQAMLIERLALKCHYEDRPTDVYVVTVGAAPLKITPATVDVPLDYGRTGGRFQQKSASLADLVFFLTAQMSREVLDLTGLQGKYSFDLDWKYAYDDPANITPLANGGGQLDPIYIIKALKSVGLKLEPRKMPMKYLIVDSVNKEPTPN
jgi:uncharacterized protein (TIGR03435 family)